MLVGIRLTLILLFLIVIVICLFTDRYVEGFAGEANDWGGAPKSEDPQALAQCETRIKELQTKWNKETESRSDNAAVVAQKKELQEQDKEKGYQDQMTMIGDNIKNAENKRSSAEQKLVEANKLEQNCQTKLTQELQKLVQPKACCDQMAKEKDDAIKLNQIERQRAVKLQESNNNLGPEVANLEKRNNQLILDTNKCDKLKNDLQYENGELKKDIQRKQQIK